MPPTQCIERKNNGAFTEGHLSRLPGRRNSVEPTYGSQICVAGELDKKDNVAGNEALGLYKEGRYEKLPKYS